MTVGALELTFAAYVAEGEVRFPRCASCGAARTTMSATCPRCLSEDVTWIAASPEGRVSSFFVAHAPVATTLPTPYVVVHVELDDGLRWIGNLAGADPDEVQVGMPVRLVVGQRDGRPTAQFVSRRNP